MNRATVFCTLSPRLSAGSPSGDSVPGPFLDFPVEEVELPSVPLSGILTVFNLLTSPSSLGLEIFIGFTASTGFGALAPFCFVSAAFFSSAYVTFSGIKAVTGKTGAGAILTSFAGGADVFASLDLALGRLLFSS